METKELWQNWSLEKEYGELFYKRATGQLPEMESSKSVAKLLKDYYQPGMTLLDARCGAGHYKRRLERVLDENISYTGMDPTAYYLELGKKAFKDGALFKEGSILDIPFASGAFDLVMCNNVVMHLPPEKIQIAFSELTRVTKSTLVIRALFGVRNYITREVLETKDFDKGDNSGETYSELNLLNSKFRYFNMYTEDFYTGLLHPLEGVSEFSFQKDIDWESFDNTNETNIKSATKTLGSLQISGNLILDWRYIIVRKG